MGLGCSPEGGDTKKGFSLSAPDIVPYGVIPVEYTITDPNAGKFGVSPELHWGNAPSGTRSFAVLVFDPDVPAEIILPMHQPGDLFVHWMVYDIPWKVQGLAKSAGAAGMPVNTGKQLKNSAGMPGYLGMGPPPGTKAHAYVFVVFALSVDGLGISPDSGYLEFSNAMKGKILGIAEFTAYCGK